MDNTPDDELEIGTEFCPICNAINTPSAAEFNCNHFIAMYWESELHWCNSELEQIVELVDIVQGRLENDYRPQSDDIELSAVFEIGYMNTADVISDVLANRLRKTDVKSDNGDYIHWYMSEVDYLDKLINRIKSFIGTLDSNNI
jgi:hypothetical protein